MLVARAFKPSTYSQQGPSRSDVCPMSVKSEQTSLRDETLETQSVD